MIICTLKVFAEKRGACIWSGQEDESDTEDLTKQARRSLDKVQFVYQDNRQKRRRAHLVQHVLTIAGPILKPCLHGAAFLLA